MITDYSVDFDYSYIGAERRQIRNGMAGFSSAETADRDIYLYSIVESTTKTINQMLSKQKTSPD